MASAAVVISTLMIDTYMYIVSIYLEHLRYDH